MSNNKGPEAPPTNETPTGAGLNLGPDIGHIMRHAEIFPIDRLLSTQVNILGAGATGSHAAVQLAKLGITRMHIWDADKVERHNLSTTVYGAGDVGNRKVDALHGIISALTGGEVKMGYTPKFFEADDPLPRGVLVLAVDTMAVRSMVLEKIKKQVMGMPVQLLIDPRSGAEQFEIHAFDPLNTDDLNAWAASLRDDKDVPPLPCMAASTPYTAAMAGAAVCQAIGDFVRPRQPGQPFRAQTTRWDLRARDLTARLTVSAAPGESPTIWYNQVAWLQSGGRQ